MNTKVNMHINKIHKEIKMIILLMKIIVIKVKNKIYRENLLKNKFQTEIFQINKF
jgi:hypothetical protein